MPGTAGSNELKRISATLSRLAQRVDDARNLAARDRPHKGRQPADLALPARGAPFLSRGVSRLQVAETLFAERRRRDAVFARRSGLGGNAAWDILLFLYIGRAHEWAVSLSHVTRATGSAATTVLRTTTRLEADGMLLRHGDPFDRRKMLLSLTDDATGLLDQYVDSLHRADPPPVQ